MTHEDVRPSGEETQERVVLLDESGNRIGHANKAEIHTDATPLHLAFSCYLFNEQGQLLLSRRALSKLTWPGVWTNSFCGHPGPGEEIEAAIHRRASEELGTRVSDVTLIDPEFRYRAIDASGVVENEICPVYTAKISGALVPNPDEVAEAQWADVDAVIEAARLTPFVFSPWMVKQLKGLSSTIQQGSRSSASNKAAGS